MVVELVVDVYLCLIVVFDCCVVFVVMVCVRDGCCCDVCCCDGCCV